MRKSKKYSRLTQKEANQILVLYKQGGLKGSQIARLKGRAASVVYELCRAGSFEGYKKVVKARFAKYTSKKAVKATTKPTVKPVVTTDPVVEAINNLTDEVKNLTLAWSNTPIKERGVLG